MIPSAVAALNQVAEYNNSIAEYNSNEAVAKIRRNTQMCKKKTAA
jgi:hypothetical protein